MPPPSRDISAPGGLVALGACFYGGFAEEILTRLFLLTGLAWLLSWPGWLTVDSERQARGATEVRYVLAGEDAVATRADPRARPSKITAAGSASSRSPSRGRSSATPCKRAPTPAKTGSAIGRSRSA